MSLTLILMRHSHAADEPGCRDFDRPLTNAGVHLAEATGRLLGELGYVPELVVASAAVRTQATAGHVIDQFESAVQTHSSDELYQGPPSAYLPAIQNVVSPDTAVVMVIGHNPGIGSLICSLAGQRHSIPPATVGIFQLDTEDWFQLQGLNHATASFVQLIANGEVIAGR